MALELGVPVAVELGVPVWLELGVPVDVSEVVGVVRIQIAKGAPSSRIPGPATPSIRDPVSE